MKSKPILFSTQMVQAILAGNKSQTRRVVKLKGDADYKTVLPLSTGYMFTTFTGDNAKALQEDYDIRGVKGVQCPYNVGQVLWVRETFVYRQKHDKYYYKADWTDTAPYAHQGWKPSIHMPKTAARIFLKVTEVRVERLQAITEDDAKAEGIETLGLYPGYDISITAKFAAIWNKINEEKAPYHSNPWVWVISFERIEKPENF